MPIIQNYHDFETKSLKSLLKIQRHLGTTVSIRNSPLVNTGCVKLWLLGPEPCQMLKVIQHFGKHCTCHLQGKCVLVRCSWKSYIQQAVCGKWDMTDLIDRAGEWAAIQLDNINFNIQHLM
jgi:hypothetical protein